MSVPVTELAPSIDRDYTREHKYTRAQGRIYLSGVQAVVRLSLLPELRKDLVRAERTSLRAPQSNDSPCHGSCGNHDVHLVARALLREH